MRTFKEYTNEAIKAPKVKKEVMATFDKKIYGSDIRLVKGFRKELDSIIKRVEKEDLYLLQHAKSYSYAFITPENLAKIAGATDGIMVKWAKVKIGRSEYELDRYPTVGGKVEELIVEGDIVDTPKPGPTKQDMQKYLNAQVLYGIKGVFNRNVAESHMDENGKVGFYTTGSDVAIIGVKGTIKTNKPSMFHIQQHSSQKFRTFDENQLEWVEVHINRLFPKAYTKSDWDKKDVLVLK